MDKSIGQPVDTTLRLGPSSCPDERQQNKDAGNTEQQDASSIMRMGANVVGAVQDNNVISPNRQRDINVDRVCMACGANTSPLWRKGPEGPQTLCNACGLKHMRALKRGA